MNTKPWLASLAVLFLAACDQAPLTAVGQLESDRIEVVAESNEPIVSIAVVEGEEVAAGTELLRQDTSRLDIRIREAEANMERIQAILDEQLAGPRPETLDAARAGLQEATVERDFRERELGRLQGLRERNLTSIESVDTAQMLLETAAARIGSLAARLAELEAGTRSEQIDQTRGLLKQAEVQLASLRFDRERLFVVAPVAAVVDSLPFEVGERPRSGDVVTVLLSGEQPFARVYIPEPQRLGISIGAELPVLIDGLEQPLRGTVRRIAAEPSFTPYFALTERDRSRLAFVAEITLPPQADRLPEGLPVQVLLE